MAPRQLRALLAMPPALRPLLLTSPNATALWPTNRGFEIIWRSYASRRPLAVGAFVIPPTPNLPLTEVPVEQLLESPTPDKTLHNDLNALFTKNPATFYHGTSNFYSLKKNTQVPEICILGRSNVGKSTFVNALANRRGNELAHTSAKAGKTRAMNAYGFGPPPPQTQLLAADTDVKRTEDMPKHSLFIVDMPGYGHKSLKEWGRNITLYLNKRQSIRGAIVLIDGEVGPKQGDLMALEMLSEAGLKTMIVLTKADKAKNGEVLMNTCKNLWTFLRDTAATDPDSDWKWDRDFFVTAVGATKKEVGVASVDIARLAVARLAGLVEEKARAEPEYPKSWSGKVVSFDELEIRPAAATTGSPPSLGVTEAKPAPKSDLDDSSTWTDLERAAREKYLSQVAQSPPPTPLEPEPNNDSGWAALEQEAQTQKDARNTLHAHPPTDSRPSRRVTSSMFRPPRRAATSSMSRLPRRIAPTSSRRLQSRGMHTSACLNRPPREPQHINKARRLAAETGTKEPPVQDEESIALHNLAQEYILELRARSLPNTTSPLKSSKHQPGQQNLSSQSAKAGSSKSKIFNPLVSRHKFTPEQRKQQRQKKREMQKRAFDIAQERVEKEEVRKLYQAEKERLKAEEEAMRLARPSHGRDRAGYGEEGQGEDDGGPDSEDRLDSDAFAESFDQIQYAQRQLKGKKAKAEAKKQKKAERMMKDRPKEEEDPFLAKFADIK
ncbi:hypothetical protein PG991_007059 [Apiospora marii]|uniref:EngB-type G domain-containing protein n=1 Tax=Apiospora marii TaxID=335849 RepID=A0ABR1RZ66_9PEZI